MISIPGKIPVTIHPAFFLIAGLIGWLSSGFLTGTIVWIVVIFISVLVHEYGHALTAFYFGEKPTIQLVAFGGVTQHDTKRLNLWKQFLIVFNGPFFGFMLGVGAYFLLGAMTNEESHLFYALMVAFYVNIFWSIVNLFPVQPLDGGHLLRILLEGALGYRGIRLSFFLSLLLGVAVSGTFFALGAIVPGAIFTLLTFESFRAWMSTKGMTAIDRDSKWIEELEKSENEFKQGHYTHVLDRCSRIRMAAHEGLLYNAATILMARSLSFLGEHKEAFDLLTEIERYLGDPEKQIYFQTAYEAKHWETIRSIGSQVYAAQPSSEVALINASAYAISNEITPAAGWLKCAQSDGYEHVDQYVQKAEFDGIRQNAEFQEKLRELSLSSD